MRSKRIKFMPTVALLLAIALMTGGCVSKPGTNPGTNTDNQGGTGAGNQEFRINLSTNPPTMDPAQAQDQVSATVINGVYEGLARMNEKGEVLPAVAKEWKLSDDKKTYTFTLRDNAKWSNGDAVTAHDFEYAWKRVLDPNLKPEASAYAYLLYYIVGAEAYNTGKGKAEEVAVKALDEHTLEVTLNDPTPYFSSLMSFQTYYPVHASSKENPAFSAEASTMITNGPFKMSEWKKNTSITLVPNEHYYEKDQIHLKKVYFTMVNDSGSELNMYQTNKLDYAGMPTGLLPIDQLEALKTSHPDEFHIQGIASLYYFLINTTEKPFDNLKIRKALSMAISRKDLTGKVTKGGQLPAYGLVPPGVSGVSKEFRDEISDDYFQEDYEEAKKLLAEGLVESNLQAMPEFSIIYNTNDLHQKVAEAIAEMWRVNLGIKANIGNQEWGVFLKNRNSLNFEIARSGWGADYNDAVTFIDLFTTQSGNNNTGYSKKEYDALVDKIYSTDDPAVRVQTMAEAEKMLMDDRPIIPLYYYTNVYMMKPGYKNIFIDFKGDINYMRGSFTGR